MLQNDSPHDAERLGTPQVGASWSRGLEVTLQRESSACRSKPGKTRRYLAWHQDRESLSAVSPTRTILSLASDSSLSLVMLRQFASNGSKALSFQRKLVAASTHLVPKIFGGHLAGFGFDYLLQIENGRAPIEPT